MLWEALSATPSENGNRPAPTGAPEGTFTIGQVNDTFRWLMAAVREVGDWVTAILAGLGTMAYQSASAVAITGGTISGTALGSTNSVDAGALTSGTISAARLPVGSAFSAQVAYDLTWPVGSQRLVRSFPLTGLVPAGVNATWQQITAAQDALLAAVGSTRVYGASGSGTDISVASAGAHTHGGTTGGHALAAAEVPALAWIRGADAGGNSMPDGADQSVKIATAPGTAHSHGIPSDGAHTHAATLPKVFSTVLLERIA